MNENNEINTNKNPLDELEEMMLEEIRFYSKTEVFNKSRMEKTDRMVKTANIILGVENLKERKYMNRTARKENERKINNMKNN